MAQGDFEMAHPLILKPLGTEDGGGYLAFFPDLPGCMSDGETPEEALENARDAYREWMVTAAHRDDFTIPERNHRARHMWHTREAAYAIVDSLLVKAPDLAIELTELHARIARIAMRADEQLWRTPTEDSEKELSMMGEAQ